MKAINIKPVTQVIADHEVRVICLGEAGRGRVQTKVVYKATCQLVDVNIPKVGKPSIIDSQSSNGYLIRISTEGSYVRGANGNVSVSNPSQVKVVARGQGAFGDAGRTGTWDDLLIAVETESIVFRVKPSRGDAYILMLENGKAHKLTYADADALGIDLLDSTTSNKGGFTRL